MNKKTTILGIIAVAFLGGLFWYFGGRMNTKNQQASILNNVDELKTEQKEDIELDEFVLGNPEALVTIIDYSSHLCGHCVNFHNQVLPLIIEEYVKSGQVKIIPRLLSPVELGMAVLCAQENDKFLEMNDYLFENVNELQSMDDLKSVSEQIGSDKNEFSACLDSNRHENLVIKWFEGAAADEVEGTPTFIVNGQKLVGNKTFSELKDLIEEELIKSE
ncbi:MAG: thioredoxin domain-containing protein [bacterium]